MSAKENSKNREKETVFERGKGLPIDHPKNCAHECPYGYDRAFCFPCYKKNMEEHNAKRKAAQGQN